MIPNTLLDDRYRILQRIGGGGMAEVFLAEDILLGRQVAVKILRSQYVGDEEFVTRFRQEARSAAKLTHPNIVSVFDVGVESDIPYIVMEYVAGVTLKQKIRDDGPMAHDLAARFACQIASALKHAHDNQIVHCDIKPHNILLSRDGIAKVADFGIARAVTSQTTTQIAGVVGSVHYLSPEQARGFGVDAKSDIYSLGIVLYEMLSGTLPFDGNTPIGVALKHLQEDPKPLKELRPDLPLSLERVVRRAMAKNPSDRYSDALELQRDMETVCRNLEGNPDMVPEPKIEKVRVKTKIEAWWERTNAKLGLNRKQQWAIGLTVLLIFGFALGHLIATGAFGVGKDVIVPDVVGKQLEAARSTLAAENLRIQVTEVNNDRIAPGTVITQTPAFGQVVKENRAIQVTVSKGLEMTMIPELQGAARMEAEARIRNSGLLVGKVEEIYSKDIKADIIISQNPKPPGQVSKGVAIDIVVSKGPSPKQFNLPDFTGEPLQSVLAKLDGMKLRVRTIRESSSAKFSPGSVIGQAPIAGSQVTEGTDVDLEVSKAETAATKHVRVATVVPDGPIRQSVQIIVNDTNGRRVIYEGVHKAGDRIERTADGIGAMSVQVFVNGRMTQEESY